MAPAAETDAGEEGAAALSYCSRLQAAASDPAVVPEDLAVSAADPVVAAVPDEDSRNKKDWRNPVFFVCSIILKVDITYN